MTSQDARRRIGPSFLVGAFLLAVAACAAPTVSVPTPVSASAVPTAQPSSTPSPPPTAAPVIVTPTPSATSSVAGSGGPVPSALRGTWQVVGITDPAQYLSLSDSQYGFYTVPDDASVGLATVYKDQLTFGARPGCAFSGTYRWKLTGPTAFTTVLIGTDPCPRSGFLANGKLTLVSRTIPPLNQ